MSRRAGTTVGILCLAAALTSCASGRDPQTYQAHTPADYTNASLDHVAIRGLAVKAPTSGDVLLTGTDAQVTGSFINNSDTPDTLTAAVSDASTAVTFLQGGKPATDIPVPALGISDSRYSLVLVGLTKDLRPGTFVSLTLNFARAGRTTLLVPVQSPGYNPAQPRPTTTNFTEG